MLSACLTVSFSNHTAIRRKYSSTLRTARIATGTSDLDKPELVYLFISNCETCGFEVATRLDCRSISTPTMKCVAICERRLGS